MSVEDAWVFPVVRLCPNRIHIVVEAHHLSISRQVGSFTLYGLYLVIKYYGSEWINIVLKWYFVTTGVGSVWSVSVTSATPRPCRLMLTHAFIVFRRSSHWFASWWAGHAGGRLRSILSSTPKEVPKVGSFDRRSVLF